MTAPWLILATTAVLLPFLPRGRAYRPRIWFPWFWSVGNLAMSWDHRAFDGVYAAHFLVKVKDILETRDWEAEL